MTPQLTNWGTATARRIPTAMTRKKNIDAAQLHDLLTDAFRKTAGDHCLRCRIPMPAHFAGAGANWRVGAIDECSTLCHSILEDVVREFAAKYQLRPPAGR
jgi:hypothetical protein